MDLDAKLTLSPSADQRDASLLAGTIRTDPQQRIRNGTLVFNRSDVVTFPGLASGSGGLAPDRSRPIRLPPTSLAYYCEVCAGTNSSHL